MRIDVWSDIACPWCWLGKHNLEEALRRLGLDGEAEVELRSFELQPERQETVPAKRYLLSRYGGEAQIGAIHRRLAAMGEEVGIRYDFERQLMANTFDAHRVHHLAKARGKGPAVVERFLRAYHGEGADLSDHGTIRRLAVEAGLDGADVDAVLASDAYAEDVRQDEAEARHVGVTGVPFFVLDGRYALAGAQPVEVFEQVLRKVRGPEAAGVARES